MKYRADAPDEIREKLPKLMQNVHDVMRERKGYFPIPPFANRCFGRYAR